MDLILAILLYLHVLVSPGTYLQSFINQKQVEYQDQINAVENDPAQMQIVNQQYMPQVSGIVVIDDTHN
jgi:hypothetical protein